MLNEKTIEQLEEELEQMKSFHRGAWDTYGGELCAADMIAKETKLEEEIFRLKQREETIKRWDKSGLLEGLKSGIKENLAQLYESQQSYIINEDPSQIVDD
jgi:hypothetical protein